MYNSLDGIEMTDIFHAFEEIKLLVFHSLMYKLKMWMIIWYAVISWGTSLKGDSYAILISIATYQCNWFLEGIILMKVSLFMDPWFFLWFTISLSWFSLTLVRSVAFEKVSLHNRDQILFIMRRSFNVLILPILYYEGFQSYLLFFDFCLLARLKRLKWFALLLSFHSVVYNLGWVILVYF